MVTVVGATRDRTDFGGWPVVVDGEVEVKPFPWMRELFAAGERAILFLDELSATREDVRPVLLRAINERALGDFPFRARVVAAANPADQSVGGFSLEAPIANRLIHLDWAMEPEVWARGMREGWERVYPALPPEPDPGTLEAETLRAQALVASYVERNPGTTNQVPEGEEAGRAWPSYRSWTLAARFLGACLALGFDEEVVAEGVVGAVGKEGYGFLNFLRQNDLPRPEEVLEDPGKLPKREDALFVVLSTVASHVVRAWTPDAWQKAWKVLALLVEQGKKDIALQAARTLAQAYANPRGGKRMPPPKEMLLFGEILGALESFRS